MARQNQQGPEALVESEFESALVDVQLTVGDDFIAQVTAHRATLTS